MFGGANMTLRLKKITAILLSVVMLFGAMPMLAADFAADAAENGDCGENISWIFDGGILEISGSGEMENYLVSKEPWYSVRSEIKTVIISENITTVGNTAFYDCSNLASVTLPSTLTSVGSNAFADCESLESIILPANLAKIGDMAFYASGIRTVVIPASVTSIGVDAFGWCDYLAEISVDENNAAFSSDENGVLYNKDKAVLIKYPGNSALTVFAVPETVAEISDYAFENSYKIKTVCIPESVSDIGYGAFFNSYLENIIVNPDNSSYSSDSSGVLFNKDKTTLIQYPINSNVTDYTVPETVTSIEDGAFHNSVSLECVHIPSGVVKIGEGILDYTDAYICSDSADCPAKEYADANGVDFVVCGEHSESRKIIASGSCGDYTFWTLYDDGEIVISGEGVTDDFDVNSAPWSDYADVIVKATVSEGVSNISKNFFNGCENLEKIDISNTVTDIGRCAFAGCSSLKNLAIPESVKAIGSEAFAGSSGIETLRYLGDTADWCAIDFEVATSNPAYFTEEFYIKGNPVVDVVIPDGTETIGAYAFAGVESVSSVTLPDSLNKIGEGAFMGCTGFKYIHIPASVTAIEDEAIPETVDFICSDSENGAAKAYAEEHGITFKLCQKHSVLGVSLPAAAEITNKGTLQLEAVINPENPVDKKVSWSSDNEKVAKVDENGVVTAVSVGEATVTVTTNDGGFTADCKITVVPRKFTITWVVNGVGTPQEVDEGAEIPVPEEPVRTGYSFDGWSTKIPETMPSRNLIFSALWTANFYDAVFDANGGRWTDGAAEKTVSSQFNSEIEIPDDPARQGYSFAGWTPVVGIMDNINGKNFTAVWLADGDTPYKVEIYTMATDGLYTLETGLFAAETDSTVTAEYTFENGFELNKEKSVLSGTVAADGSLVLKVYLDRVKSTITINGEVLEVIFGQLINEPETTDIPEGHSHSGWADENGNTVEFPLVVGENMPSEISPVFVKNSYKVVWKVDDASTEEIYEFGAEIIKPSNPVKNGYTFKGWTPEVPDSMPAYNLTFVAVFDKNTYTCSDCGELFDDETKYNEHVAYEQAKKAVRVSIRNNPGTATIKYGETLVLTAIKSSEVSGTKLYWYVDGEKQGEGETFSISFKSGTKTVTVKIVDENGNVLKDESGNEISDEQKVSVNSSFWQKIVSFFKNLFRMNRTVTQSVFKNIF